MLSEDRKRDEPLMGIGGLDSRQHIRTAMQQKRLRLTPEEVDMRSQQVAAKLANLKPIQDADVIMGYCSVRNEVNLTPFLRSMQLLGKTIILPRVVDKMIMEAVLFNTDNLADGDLGIPEPGGDPYDAAKIDVILIPGLAYDYQGYRLGYGRGYYDRFLSSTGKPVFKCGVCYEFQVVETIAPHPGDIPVHWIVTDQSELVIDWSYF